MSIERNKFLNALIEATETEPEPTKGIFGRMTDALDRKFNRLRKKTRKDMLKEVWLRSPIGMLFADKDD